jgi:peptidoglycan L-alanyl-D-glutamate endopeptidase CwlK
MGFKFGERSIDNLDTAHADLKLIMQEALHRSMVDFGVSEGYRSLERQLKLFKEGKSRIDGIKKKGKHNHFPSLAVDIYAYVPGNKKLAYDKAHLGYLAGVIMTVADLLLEEGEISHRLRWGGNWDGDGTLLVDQNLKDMPHFELVKK